MLSNRELFLQYRQYTVNTVIFMGYIIYFYILHHFHKTKYIVKSWFMFLGQNIYGKSYLTTVYK